MVVVEVEVPALEILTIVMLAEINVHDYFDNDMTLMILITIKKTIMIMII